MILSELNRRLQARSTIIALLYEAKAPTDDIHDIGKQELLERAREYGVPCDDPSKLATDEEREQNENELRSLGDKFPFMGEVRFPIDVAILGRSHTFQAKVTYAIVPHYEYFDLDLDRLVKPIVPRRSGFGLYILDAPEVEVTQIEEDGSHHVIDNTPRWKGPVNASPPFGFLPPGVWLGIEKRVYKAIADTDRDRRAKKGLELPHVDHYSPGFVDDADLLLSTDYPEG